MIVLLAVVAMVVQAPNAKPASPAEAIAIADANPDRGTPGVYEMTVAAVNRTPYALYLNSSPDYRAPDDVTFHLTARAAKTLEKRLGAIPETVLLGKKVVVRGDIRAVPIANTLAGRVNSFNRYQHTVLVTHADHLAVY